MKSYCKTFIDFFQSMFSNYNNTVQAMFSLSILRRLSQNIFRMFLVNVTLEHSGNETKTSRWERFQEH